jgi:hypothetical protein
MEIFSDEISHISKLEVCELGVKTDLKASNDSSQMILISVLQNDRGNKMCFSSF